MADADGEIVFETASQAGLREGFFGVGEARGIGVGQGHARGIIDEHEQFGAVGAEDFHGENRAAHECEQQHERDESQRAEHEARAQREALGGAAVADDDEHQRERGADEQQGFSAGREGPFRHAETRGQQTPRAIGKQGETGEERGHAWRIAA